MRDHSVGTFLGLEKHAARLPSGKAVASNAPAGRERARPWPEANLLYIKQTMLLLVTRCARHSSKHFILVTHYSSHWLYQIGTNIFPFYRWDTHWEILSKVTQLGVTGFEHCDSQTPFWKKASTVKYNAGCCLRIVFIMQRRFPFILNSWEFHLEITEEFNNISHPLLFLPIIDQRLANFVLNGQIVNILGLGS